jgi:hypothetical protein
MSNEKDPFEHWADLMNKAHGYAGVFASVRQIRRQ